MKFYEMSFFYDEFDKSNSYSLMAQRTNVDEIEIDGIPKGNVSKIIYGQGEINDLKDAKFFIDGYCEQTLDDYLRNIINWPLVSEKTKNALGEVNGIRFYPVSIINGEDNEIIATYYLLYIENFIDAYNMEKSKYRYNQKHNIYFFMPMDIYMNENVCNNYDIFRCNQNNTHIYVSEKIKSIIENQGLTGVKFLPQKG